MKPSFALDFRGGLVTLLHRTSRGWSQVGSAAFDTPDFAEALGYLRSTALGLSPRGITTKLIIPNDQILYTHVHAPGPELAKRRRQIKAGLEGRTPYGIEDLVYDWSGAGPEVNVAVVARETLAEAEAFAVEHRFNPVSFVGVPEGEGYPGEAFFGQTTLSETLLTEGEKVERDQVAVAVIARDFPRAEAAAVTEAPAPEAPAPEAPAPEAAAPEVSAPAPAPSAAEAPAAPPSDEPAAEPAPMEEYFKPSAYSSDRPVPARPEPARPELAKSELAQSEPNQPDLPQPEAAKAEPPKGLTPAPEAAEAPAPAPESARAEPPAAPRPPVAEFAAKPTPPMPAAPLPPQGAAFSADPKPAAKAPVPEAPMAMDVAPEAILPDEDDIPPAPAAEIVAAFASRRTAAIAAGGVAKPSASKIPAVGAAPNPRAAVPRPNLARPTAAPAQPAAAKPGASTIRPPVGKTAKVGGGAAGASVTAPGILGAKRERPTVAATTAETPEIAARRAAAKPQTGLGSRPVATKGKPRYLGLILTGLLLLLLAAVAAWSSFFIGTNDTTGALTPEAGTSQTASVTAPATTPQSATPTETAPATTASAPETAAPANAATATDTTATAPQTAAPDPQTRTTPAADNAQASLPTETALPETAPADAAAKTATSATEAAVPPPEGLASAAAAPGDGTSGSVASPATVADTAGKDGIVLAGVDAPPRITGTLAPPSLAAGADASPAAEPPPPPFGTVYKFDAEGRIIPTPEGIMTPEGVLLVAGKPKQLPPDRPAALSVLTTPPSASDAATAASAPVADPATAAATPGADGASTTAPANPADAAATASTSASTPATPPAPGAVGSAAAVPAPSLPAVVAPALVAPAAAAPEPLAQDPTLAGKRPKARPAALSVPSDQQGALSQSTTDVPVVDSRLAGFRPQARPAGLAAAKTAVLAPDTGADATAASASLAANGATLLTSPKPQARPTGMDQAVVNDAVQAALSQTQPQATVKVQPAAKAQVAANTAVEPLDEPDLESPAPSLPTNASVAKQATVKRGLNTSQIALLAVFGTPSTRFAMIRQANGAVKRVKVGDNLDGGRVAAISDTSVQYQRGGRIVTLSLPSG